MALTRQVPVVLANSADPRRVKETEPQLQVEAEGVRGSGKPPYPPLGGGTTPHPSPLRHAIRAIFTALGQNVVALVATLLAMP